MSDREIRFRAWVEPNVEVCHPYMNYHPEFHGEINDIFKRNGVKSRNSYGSKITYMQYTGLRDSKRTEEYPEGQEIYEGDIIKTINGVIATVEWEKEGRFLGFTIENERKILYISREPRVEIMGNIYENSELLEKSTCS